MDYGSKRLNELASRYTKKTGLSLDTLRKRQKLINAMPGTMKQLMGQTGFSDSTVRTHLAALKREGYLVRATVPNARGMSGMAGFFDTTLPKYTTEEPLEDGHRMVALVPRVTMQRFKTIWANGVNPYGDQTQA